MKEGIDGLLHDKTRPSRIPPLGPEVAARVVALTLADPPVETTHWTADLMARASGISASAVRRIWKAHGLQPHRYPTPNRSPSHGPQTPTKSSPPSDEGTKC